MRNVSKFVEKIKTHFMFNFLGGWGGSCRLWDIVEKYCTVGHASDDNMAHGLRMLDT